MVVENTLSGLLAQIAVTEAEPVTQEQRDMLLAILKESLLAYKTGAADAILADRLRAAYTIPTALHAMLSASTKQLLEMAA